MFATLLQRFAVSYDYDYSSQVTDATNTYTAPDAGLATVGVVFLVLALALSVFMLVAMWKLFTKAHQPGWAAIVPIYNTIVMLKIVGRPVWWFFLLLIPFVNLVISIIVTNDLSKSFGKDVGFTIGLVLLPIIFFPMLAFGSAQYGGPSVKPTAA